MNRRDAMGLLLVAAEATVLPTLAVAAPGEEPPALEPKLRGFVFKWARDGYYWQGRAKTDLRRVAMRIWTQKPGISERTEEAVPANETGTFAGFTLRFHGGPKLGGLLHMPGVYDRDAMVPHLHVLERSGERSLMYYQLLGTTDHDEMASRIAERYPNDPNGDEWAKACWQWRKDNEYV